MAHVMTFEEVIFDSRFFEEDLLEIEKQLKELMRMKFAERFNWRRVNATKLESYFRSSYEPLEYYYELGNYSDSEMIALGEQLGSCQTVFDNIRKQLSGPVPEADQEV